MYQWRIFFSSLVRILREKRELPFSSMSTGGHLVLGMACTEDETQKNVAELFLY